MRNPRLSFEFSCNAFGVKIYVTPFNWWGFRWRKIDKHNIWVLDLGIFMVDFDWERV